MTDHEGVTDDHRPRWVRVRAVPTDPQATSWLIECNLCGTVGISSDTEADDMCIEHLEQHSVDTSAYREPQSTEDEVPD